MLVSMQAEGISPYYVKVNYDRSKFPLYKQNCTAINKLPVFQINTPQKEFLTVLKILHDKPLTKSQLIKKFEIEKIIKPKETSALSSQAKHSQLQSILLPIEDLRLVKRKGRGKLNSIVLTKKGEQALKFFGD